MFFCLSAATGWSQAAVTLDPAAGSTVSDLVRLALERNADLLAGESQIAAAKGNVFQAGLRPNPMLSANAMKQIRGSMNSFMLEGSLPLELHHRRDRRIEVAERDLDVSSNEQEDRRRLLREAVESKFGDVLATLRNLAFTSELLALNQEALRLTQTRADQGAVPPLDADLLRVEVNRIDAARTDLESQLETAALELKSLVGLNPDDPLRIRGAIEDDFLLATQEEAIRRALATRPDLLAARAMEAAAAARLRETETQGKLDASASASYERTDFGFDIDGFGPAGDLRRIQEVFHQVTVGVSLTLPTRNRNQGAIAAATAEIEAARRRREYAELIARKEVASAFVARAKAAEGISIYRQGVRDQSRQNLTVIRRVYELGRSQLLDVVAEQRRLVEVEMGYTDMLNRYYQAAVRVRAAANLE